MYHITVDVLCLNGYSEVLPDDRENTELIVADLTVRILLDLFSAVAMTQVTVICSTAGSIRQPHSGFHIQAICAADVRRARIAPASLEMRLENALCCALLELFSYILMDKIIVHEESSFATLLRSA